MTVRKMKITTTTTRMKIKDNFKNKDIGLDNEDNDKNDIGIDNEENDKNANKENDKNENEEDKEVEDVIGKKVDSEGKKHCLQK